jgi:competence protein ComEC
LSRARGAGFVAETWLENDGSGRDQAAAADLWPLHDRPKIARIGTSGTEIIHLQGKSVTQDWSECTRGQLIVAEVSLDLQGPCVVISPDSLKHSGALALFVTDTGSYFLSDREITGHRLWNPGPKTAPVEVAARSQ